MALESDLQVDRGEEEEECLVETITEYGKRITESLKNAVTYTVAASRHANDSLVDLQSQNENINRIKNLLNDSHNTVTVTQKIVDSYVNSMRWIRSSISWQKHTTLENGVIEGKCDDGPTDSGGTSYWRSIFRGAGSAAETSAPAANDPVGAALGDFSTTASQHLDTLISELRTNRQKTQLIANAVQQQNDELEKIGDSAILLQQRVAQVNRVLQDNV